MGCAAEHLTRIRNTLNDRLQHLSDRLVGNRDIYVLFRDIKFDGKCLSKFELICLV